MRLESQGFILVNGRNIRDSIQAITEMMSQMTPVEVIESDEDNTLISRIENELGVRFKKKKLDRNYCVKNIVKHLYDLRNSKQIKDQQSGDSALHKMHKVYLCKKSR